MRVPAIVAVALVGGVLLGTGCASKHFVVTQVSPGIFEGIKPRTQSDFDTLHSKGIRTVLSLEQVPWDVWPERRRAQKNGFIYRDVPILASPLEPSERRVKQALQTLSDPSLRPIYTHCLLGEDRNTFIVGLYRVYYEGWTPEAAWAEMRRRGFHVRWTLFGFTSYFWNHTQRPDWVIIPNREAGK